MRFNVNQHYLFNRHVKWKRKLKHHVIYTHTVHTCMSVLNCPSVTDKSGTILPVRNFDGLHSMCIQVPSKNTAKLSILILENSQERLKEAFGKEAFEKGELTCHIFIALLVFVLLF